MLKYMRLRFRNRPDSEHEQALIRLIVGFFAAAYLITAIFWDGVITEGELFVLWICPAFFLLSLTIILLIARNPGIVMARRYAGIVLDTTATSLVMFLAPRLASPLFVVYLWVTFGNGFRFGIRYLVVSASFSFLGFTIAAVASPHWHSDRIMLGGIIVGLIILPAYVAALLGRLNRALSDARAASVAKGRFLANMSHEIRTPLTGILGTAELLQTENLSDAQRTLVRRLIRSADGLIEIINSVLDYSKIEAKRLVLETTEFDLGDVTAQLKAIFEAAAQAKGLVFRIEIDEALVSSVHGDPVRLRQILANLIGNAIKFTEEGSVSLRISRSERSTESALFVRFEVADTGHGIAPGDQASIFDSFTQADDSTTRRYGGTGLGLAISRQLVRAMGGELVVESAPGGGAKFSFVIPLAAGTHPRPIGDESDNVRQPSVAPVLPQAALESPPVLLVDDQELNRELFSSFFQMLGYRTEVATNGQEAVDMFAAKSYAIIFMDCQMPVLDGYRATEKIRALEKEGSRIPIIALTAHALAGDREKCLAAGMDDYLGKPFRLHALQTVLERWLPAAGRVEA